VGLEMNVRNGIHTSYVVKEQKRPLGIALALKGRVGTRRRKNDYSVDLWGRITRSERG